MRNNFSVRLIASALLLGIAIWSVFGPPTSLSKMNCSCVPEARGSDGITGKLISAVWDPWSTLSEHLGELQSTDIYTLRRITPEDRDMKWGNR